MAARSLQYIASVLLFSLILTSCGGDYYPKPYGQFRIDLPEKAYIRFDSVCPYSFDYPVYSRISFEPASPGEKYWMNIEFPRFRGKVHLSYKPVKGNLNDYIEDARTMAMKHIPKASGIRTESFSNGTSKVYGLTYIIEGVEAASPFQFYLTDSTDNFIRGALYFSVVPNNDSLAPVIEFLESDIRHLIESLEWKEL